MLQSPLASHPDKHHPSVRTQPLAAVVAVRYMAVPRSRKPCGPPGRKARTYQTKAPVCVFVCGDLGGKCEVGRRRKGESVVVLMGRRGMRRQLYMRMHLSVR